MSIEKLNHLALVEISGDDAESFLQGQLTNDLTLLGSTWQYSGYCSPKGRLIALLQLYKAEDKIYALIEASLLEPTLQRLRMYVMRSKVKIVDLPHAQIFALKSIEQLPQAWRGGFSNTEVSTGEGSGLEGVEDNSAIVGDDVCLLTMDNDCLLIDTAAQLNTSEVVLHSAAQETGEERWWLDSEISAGRPRVTLQSQELFIPQMLNLDVLNAISFKKGCYTGQEIVARMHYLGKLKQRMFLCETEDTQGLEIGQKITASSEVQKNLGTVVSFSDNSKQLLAVLRLESLTQGTGVGSDSGSDAGQITLLSEAGKSIQVLSEQPYELPPMKKA